MHRATCMTPDLVHKNDTKRQLRELREKDAQTNRETDRKREIERQTDRKRDRQ